MARNGKTNRNAEDAVAFSNIFDFEDPITGEKYTRRPEPVVSTSSTRKGKKGGIDEIVPDNKNRGWMQGWEKARKRVATSPVSFHTDELEPMLKGLFGSADNLEQPFRDKQGDLFGGMGLSRKGPQYGLPLDVRMRTLLGDVKRGDDIIDCYVRGLETPSRRKTYSLQQPPGRSFGLGGSTRDEKAWMDRMMDTISGKGGKSSGASQTTQKPGYYQQDFVPKYGEKDRADNVGGYFGEGGTGYSTKPQDAPDAYQPSTSAEDAVANNRVYTTNYGQKFWVSAENPGVKRFI